MGIGGRGNNEFKLLISVWNAHFDERGSQRTSWQQHRAVHRLFYTGLYLIIHVTSYRVPDEQ